MSRTFRSYNQNIGKYFRFPHTFNEIKSLDAILHDDELSDFPISGLNHMRAREKNLPTSWDDKVVSAYYQEDYKVY